MSCSDLAVLTPATVSIPRPLGWFSTLPPTRFDRDLRPHELYQAGWISERGGGVVRQGDEGAAESHVAGPGVGEAALERHDELLALRTNWHHQHDD